MWLGALGIYFAFLAQITWVSGEQRVWAWECENYQCVKKKAPADSTEHAFNLEECRMFCEPYGVLWPRPTGEMDLGNFLSKINQTTLTFKINKYGRADELLGNAIERFKHLITSVAPKGVTPKHGKDVDIELISENTDLKEFSLDMDESYHLTIAPDGHTKLRATIKANNFFGLRHGLETLSQLILYDEHSNHVLMVRDVTIFDRPVYPYRGILLDTSRNYYSVDSIKTLIDSMAMVKLNSFHWHITDSHSFPFVSERRPELSKYGAYSPAKVYTKRAIEDVVEYAAARGVRVVPELDAPAHIGEGWPQHLITCFNAQPWFKYCVEPPCGQFNPVKEEVYNYLGDLYTEMAESFKPDLFHMGGDEVSEACWNNSTEITEYITERKWDYKNGFLNLWGLFQLRAQQKVYEAFGKKVPLILWTSTLTDFKYINNYLDPKDYIIQAWTTADDVQVEGLLSKGFRIIMSNTDALYLDCGFGSWVDKGQSWCSYNSWQAIYDNKFNYNNTEYAKQVLGGEAALWSEQADETTLDSRMWPRAAALAERLWADPSNNYKTAVNRMHSIRNRLVRMGIRADSLQPEWCSQNAGHCRR